MERRNDPPRLAFPQSPSLLGRLALDSAAFALAAELRFGHLKTHLAQTALMHPAQVRRYMALRGYEGGA